MECIGVILGPDSVLWGLFYLIVIWEDSLLVKWPIISSQLEARFLIMSFQQKLENPTLPTFFKGGEKHFVAKQCEIFF